MASRISSVLDDDRLADIAALRADAQAAIAALGDRASMKTAVGSLAFFGSRLGWPDWLYAGSSLAGQIGPLPAQITAANDLLISANLFAVVGPATLAEQSVRLPQPATGPVGRLALASTPDLGAAFCYLQRLVPLGSPYCHTYMAHTNEMVLVGVTGAVPLGRLLDYLGLLFLAFHYRAVDDLIAEEISSASIRLTLPDGPHGPGIRSLFRCDVQFGAAANELHVPSDWLALPNASHDGPLWALAHERLKAAEAQYRDADFIRGLRQFIATTLTEQRRVPRLKQVAQAQGMSTRSLVRQLAAEGQSFHDLVDQELRQRAATLINDPALSIRTISEALGFPDVSSFGRKFRLWFGDSPGRFRRDHR